MAYLDRLIETGVIGDNVLPCSALGGMPILVVAMKEDRWASAQRHLASVGLTPVNRCHAVVGRTIDPDTVRRAGIIPHHFDVFGARTAQPGTIGCMLSHLCIWRWFLTRTTYPYIVVTEEDLRPDQRIVSQHESVPRYVAQAVRAMQSDWCVLYLGSCLDDCRNYVPVPGVPHLVRTSRSLCTHAYVISRRGAQRFLDNLPMVAGIDSDMHFIARTQHLPVYATTPSLFWQAVDEFPSLIRSAESSDANCTQCAAD